MAQGILHSQCELHANDATIAFNSQRLHEACKAKGVLQLHLLQKEAAQLKTKYQTNITPDEMTARQMQHNQFHVSPKAQHKHKLAHESNNKSVDGYFNKAGDLAIYIGKTEAIRDFNKMSDQQSSPLQKPPLQQQLMQHRLLQQKRQILQKQVALENGLSRRQMLRQQSYKIAQQQQVLPPLPLSDIESEDLLAFQALVEGPMMVNSNQLPKSPINGSPKTMKTSHIQQQLAKPPLSPCHLNDCWSSISGSMQTCQISDNNPPDNGWVTQPAHYQVQFNNNHQPD